MVNGLPSKQKLWVRFPLPVNFFFIEMLKPIEWQFCNLLKSIYSKQITQITQGKQTNIQKEKLCYFSVIARSGFSKKTTEAKSLFTLKNKNFFNTIFSKKINKNSVSKNLQLFKKRKQVNVSKKNKKKTKQISFDSTRTLDRESETFSEADAENSIQFLRKNYIKSSQKKTTLRTATKILSCFARRGNHPRRNNLFTKYRKMRAKKTKRTKKLPLPFYRPIFFHAATPFLRLKTRRQRKRRGRKKLFQKINFRRRETGERQSYLLFSKVLQKSKKSTKSRLFRDQIQTQRESLFLSKNRRKIKVDLTKQKQRQSIQTTGAGANVIKNIRQIRDEMHKRAFRMKPRKWRFKSRKARVSKTFQKKKPYTTKQTDLEKEEFLTNKKKQDFFFSNTKNIFKQKKIYFKLTKNLTKKQPFFRSNSFVAVSAKKQQQKRSNSKKNSKIYINNVKEKIHNKKSDHDNYNNNKPKYTNKNNTKKNFLKR